MFHGHAVLRHTLDAITLPLFFSAAATPPIRHTSLYAIDVITR